jgi:hypothetical protein
MTLTTLTELQKTFAAVYTDFTHEHQNVLKCLSVIYEPISRTHLVSSLNQAGFRNDKGSKYVVKDISTVIKNLEKLNLVQSSPQGVRCNPEIVELASRQAVADGSFKKLAHAVRKSIAIESLWGDSVWYRSYERGVREIRIAFYNGQKEEELIRIFMAVNEQFPEKYSSTNPFELILFNPFDKETLLALSPLIIQTFIFPYIEEACLRLQPAAEYIDFIEEYSTAHNIEDEMYLSTPALYAISCGTMESITTKMESWQTSEMLSYRGWSTFLQGNIEEALHWYRLGLEIRKKETGKRTSSYDNFAGIFYVIALLQSGDNDNFQEALTYLARVKKHKNFLSYSICPDLDQTLLLALGQRNKARRLEHSLDYGTYFDFPSVLIAFLTRVWQGEEIDKRRLEALETLQHQAEENGYYWFAKEATAILLANNVDTAANRQRYDKLKGKCPLPDLCQIIRPRENWEHVLEALTHLNSDGNQSAVPADERLVWLIAFDDELIECEIVPRLQKLGKNGNWTKGRAVALSTLCTSVNTLPYLSDQDKNVVGAIQKSNSSSWGYYGNSPTYAFQMSQALPALVDHPLLFWHENPTVQVELVKGSPELHVVKETDSYVVSLSPFIDEGQAFGIIKESPTRLKYIPLTQDYARICNIIGTSVKVPFQAKDKVLEALSKVARVLTIQSDIGGTSANAQTVTADPRPYVHLLPYSSGLQMEVLCRPLSAGGSYYQPGSGGRNVLAEIEGQQLQTKRDLQLERDNAEIVYTSCPSLIGFESLDNEWLIDEPEKCLELLLELRELGDSIVVEWPKGESFKVTSTVSFANFTMSIQRNNDWFGATGLLKVDEDLTLDMKKLLALCRGSKSRFVQLDDGRFLALSKAFRQRIEELRAFSENHSDGVRFSPLAGLALEEFTEEIGHCDADDHWTENVHRFQTVNEPTLPSTLQATLRDYQLEGFRWLGRLSSLQVGACLADDMGLGKTVQTLAAILLRAPDGPTLVVAPTSVMMNWQDEATRFAPTLSVHIFGDGNRQESLNNLTDFDLVICSYGMLQSEAKMLSQVHWQTVVLDEAQAIKNMQTQRSKAAMQLQAEFKVITTGTPIENHLGELWNLFRFINPGLLGSYESFKRTFATPIEKNQDKTASANLRKLIQPFILRRLKHAVLQELPSRTEVTMQVEMSAEEAAMYEVQRQQALESLAAQSGENGQQHLQVLAEITRLRRFCCNPELVLPDSGIASSKLKVFTTIVEELLENKHKALVFSQFVGHLALIRNQLDALGISYQYLDGSTSVNQRAERVKAFQAGHGDLFLISLKAGGAGLNLTAADYVIHMDPWWNPAVEDQASDRAHRIGQRRPVTIYRLVVKDSIEEKIVALHKEKRDLADTLLSGSDMSGRISTAELLQLLKQE